MQTIWSFMQRFIDEGVNTIVLSLSDSEISLTHKMNSIDWVARNAEFLSPEAITKSIAAYKDLAVEASY